ncbi:MAG: excinuclease ABC subunit UvrA, partial [Candidatus Competibacteraceae bacterium]|nr:excinuclease ABC subunit UvrA [Candidatus Competibacteraceae bacterium]
MDTIKIRGARTHNLQNIDLDLPRDRLIVITGLSGSGKSSLAFDTLYAEGQRRYVESLSAYARQFLSLMEKPDVDHIEGLSPAISIEQKSTSHNPRSTVGTITEIYDYLRLLYARAGIPHCPDHGIDLDAQTVSQMVDQILILPEGQRLMLLAPVVKERKGEHVKLLQELRAQGFIRARIDGEVVELDSPPTLDLRRKHTIEVVVDRFKARNDLAQRLAESFETALRLGEGVARVAFLDEPEQPELLFSSGYACPLCGYSLSELEPRLFSFNNPVGACPECDGLGVKSFFDPERVVMHPHLSLAEGAVYDWGRDNRYHFHLIEGLAQHYGFDPEQSFQTLPEGIRQLILHGSGEETVTLDYVNHQGEPFTLRQPFAGVLPEMERRYRETDSSILREMLARYMSSRPCLSCQGARLTRSARHVFIAGHALPDVASWPVGATRAFFAELRLPGRRGEIAAKVVKEIGERLNFLVNVGLDYLSLARSADTLSGGEAQRIRLASQIGAGLVGVLYVLDEPSIGLHQRDNARLLASLLRLRDLGNTVIVVEHDEEAIRTADQVVDMGPGAGVHGGRVVAQGTPADIMTHPESLTGAYLDGQRRIAIPKQRTPFDLNRVLRIIEARGNNLKNLHVEIPIGLLTCVTGVSGSGKSTLINDTLYRYAARDLNNANESPAPCRDLLGLEYLDKVVNIDQSPIGRTPRSNPATYTGLFTPIRELFSEVPEARARGYKPGR